jgi:CheY-like chemotaxis protein
MTAANESASRPILVVEDSDDDLALLQHLLRAARIENPTVVARSGAEAITLLRRMEEANDGCATPSVVLTDLKMPGVTGLELTAWMRSHTRFAGVRVIMLSASNLPSDTARAKAVGVDKFFVKFPTARELRGLLA